jgi:serine/threonine protein kinase/DNA-binding response OmpR family regulator
LRRSAKPRSVVMGAMAADDEPRDPNLLGAILVATAGLSIEVLSAALARQRSTGGRLGEILVAMRAITEEQLTTAVRKQAALRGPRATTGRVQQVERPAARPVGPGAVVGHYRLIELIGQGAMGDIYLGEHVTLGRRVALKKLRSEFATDTKAVERFFNEARAVNEIAHQHIVEVSDFIADDGPDKYYVMELLTGENLAELQKREGILPLSRSLNILAQVCDALAAVHEAGIVHRDLKPENIFLTVRDDEPDFVKLLDFGVAKLKDSKAARKISMQGTDAGTILGTPEYMSPEQARGLPVNYRSDAYSFGVILYELCTGKKPTTARSFGELILKLMNDTPPRPREVEGLPHEIPPDLEDLVLHCLEKDPERRPQSMKQIESTIWAIQLGGFAGPSMSLSAVAAPPIVRHRVLILPAVLENELGPGVLDPRSFEVRTAADAHDALVLAAEWQPALILMDSRLPDVPAFDFCRLVREDEALRGTKLLMVTDQVPVDASDDVVYAAVDAHLIQPMEERQLLHTVGALIDARVRQGPAIDVELLVQIDDYRHDATDPTRVMANILRLSETGMQVETHDHLTVGAVNTAHFVLPETARRLSLSCVVLIADELRLHYMVEFADLEPEELEVIRTFIEAHGSHQGAQGAREKGS